MTVRDSITRFFSTKNGPQSTEFIDRDSAATVKDLLGGRDQKVIADAIEAWRSGKPVYNGVNFEALVKEGWRRNELIFAAISKTANTSAQVKLRIYNKRSKKPLEDHPAYNLIRSPNEYMTEFDFWAAVIIYQKLAGVAYFEKERNNFGEVIKLWPLRPDWMHPVPLTRIKLAAYEYAPPGVDPQRIDPENVLVFKVWDPMGLFDSWPPAAVAARSGDIDNSATDYLKLFFDKGGTPPGILKTVQKLQDSQVTLIRRRWRERYGGFEHWMEPAVLDADAEYQRIGLTFKEMGFEVLDGRNEARICQVIDIPPILIGAKVGLDRATYSNYGEARSAWWEDSLVPAYVNIGDAYQNQIVSEYGDLVYSEWDFGKVPALQEDRQLRWTRAISAFNAGALTRNQFYSEVGMPEIGPRGDVYVMNSSAIEVPIEERLEKPEPAPALPAPAAEPAVDGNNNGTEPDTSASWIPHTHQKGPVAANAPDEEERVRYERQLAKKLQEYFEGQKKRLQEAIDANTPD